MIEAAMIPNNSSSYQTPRLFLVLASWRWHCALRELSPGATKNTGQSVKGKGVRGKG